VPLHYQVYRDLSAAIAAGQWKRGDQLPVEKDLAARYGCSLITVRRALDELTREGRLERTRGRGTFVTEPPILQNIGAPVGFAEELRGLGYTPYSVTVTARTEEASPAVAGALGIPAGRPVHYLERVRGADGMPMLLEQVRLPADLLPGLLGHDFEREESLWDVLRDDYHQPVERRQEVISAIVPNAREMSLLGLRSRRPSIQFEGTAFTTANRPIEVSRTVVSPDRARFFVESGAARVRLVTPVDDADAARVDAAQGDPQTTAAD